MKNRKIKNIFFVNTESPITAVSIWIGAGSKDDPNKKEGLAHFFEHIFMTETIKFKDRKDRLREIESNGIYFNAFTTKDKTVFFQIQPKEKTYLSLDLLLDGFLNSQINSETFKKEKKVILDEELRNRDSISDYIWRLRDKTLWPKSDLSKDLYGNKKTISSITLKDIADFRDLYYSENNVFLLLLEI